MIHEGKRGPKSSKAQKSERDMHVVVIAKRAIAIRAFAGPRSEPFFDAVFAENMTASLDRGVFEIPAAYCAKGKSLHASQQLKKTA
jgi:hypothetical protein